MSLSSVVTMGYLPVGDASLPLVALFGYSNGAEPPPPPVVTETQRYGPALTPRERRRWFGDEETPEQRSARRAAIERLKRIEIGLIEPSATEEERAETEEIIEAKVDAVLPSIAVRPLGKTLDQKAVVDKVVKAVAAELKAEREKMKLELEEEEREAMSLLAGMLFGG